MNVAEILSSAQTIAVVGCSPRPSHTSHYIAKYLIRAGFEVIPVNPYHQELLERPCYPDLVSIPQDVEIDIVNVFRRSQFTAETVRDAVTRAGTTDQRPVIWTQYGVHSAEAQQLAEAAGLPYIASRCIMVDHGSLAKRVPR
jgi:uncharacterized protein